MSGRVQATAVVIQLLKPSQSVRLFGKKATAVRVQVEQVLCCNTVRIPVLEAVIFYQKYKKKGLLYSVSLCKTKLTALILYI
jgi:hypothetical protein